jgi:ubiquinone biosynthesis protein UbiJ
MGRQSRKLLQLRPVTFRYKTDPQREQQYGLIAEEVATVYPELVTRGTDGQVQSVRYYELTPMLLNEVQRQQQQMAGQARQLSAQTQEIAELKAQTAALMTRLARLEERAPHAATLVSR